MKWFVLLGILTILSEHLAKGQQGCTENDVRLVDGSSELEGRVEICIGKTWGTICDDQWDLSDGNVVCKQLGFESAIRVPPEASFGPGTGPIVLDNVNCTGNEQRLIDCPHFSDPNVPKCEHFEDSSVICSPCKGELRLVGGNNEFEGRVEICYNKRWGTICDDNWDNNDAMVICRQLDFLGGNASGDAAFGEGVGLIWLDHVACNGNEQILTDCTHSAFGVHDCRHFEDAGVTCDTDECLNGTHNCDVNATCTNTIGNFTCTCNNGYMGDGITCADIDECLNGTHNCDVNATCTNTIGNFTCTCNDGYIGDGITCTDPCTVGDVRLVGGVNEFEGRVEVCYNRQWDIICNNTEWDNNDAMVVCRQLGYSGGIASGTFEEVVKLRRLVWLDCNGTEQNLTECTATGLFRLVDGCSDFGDALVTCDINECLNDTHNCDVNAECTNTNGSFTCTCNDGYMGDGITCTDIDECLNGTYNCDVNATCTNTNGSFTCTCSEGYIGDGITCSAACTEGDVRLVGGNSSLEGLVEICINETWGSVCDDEWDSNNGDVVCRQLGFGIAFSIPPSGVYGQGTGPLVLGNVDCRGTEERLTDCPKAGTPCALYGGSFVICSQTSPCTIGDVRLVGGPNEFEGRVEVCHNRRWGVICDSLEWDNNNAMVVCRQLGYSGGTASQNSTFEEVANLHLLFSLVCNGTEQILNECTTRGFERVNDCRGFGDVLVTCDIDECLNGTLNCDVNATCINTNGSFTCTCNDGYIGDGITCTATTCNALDPPSNGAITYSPDQKPPFDVLTEAVYSCHAGYRLSDTGNGKRTCVTNELGTGGEWTGNVSTCKFFAVTQCPALPVMPELNFKITYTVDPDPDYPAGTFAIYICISGTTIRAGDRVYRSCYPDGTWTGEEPVCQALQGCVDISDPANGNINFTEDTTAPFDEGTKAIYSCDPGYSLLGNSVKECVVKGTVYDWSGDPSPTCSRIHCPPVEAPTNGSVKYSENPHSGNYPFSTVASFSCFEGYGIEGNQSSVECRGNGSSQLGEFSPDPPSCQLITCSPLKDPENGQVSYDYPNSTILPYGTVAKYSCTPRHFLVGEAVRVCIGFHHYSFGYFNGTQPTCREITCPPLDTLNYGSIKLSSNTSKGPQDVGVVAFYSCDEGYSLENGDHKRICQQDGTWDGEAPMCNGTCQSLRSIADGLISYSMPIDENNKYLAGTVVNYTCDDGRELFGDYTRMCQDNMTWTGIEPRCLIACPSLDKIVNGTIQYSSAPNTAGSYHNDTSAWYRCNEGYRISDSVDRRICQLNMTWSGQSLTCEPIMCPDLPDPLYGDIEYMKDKTAPFELATIAVYRCNEGFVLVGGDQKRKCLSNDDSKGEWNGTAPSCQAVTCPELPLPANVSSIVYSNAGTPNEFMYLTRAEYTCEEGFEITSGDYISVCMMDRDNTTGAWSGQELVCSSIVARCPDIPNPVNGLIEFEGDPLSPFELGTLARYFCDVGYALLEGDNTRICEMDGFSDVGVWSGEPLSCVAMIECPPLEVPVNGSIVYSEVTLGFGVLATYSCDENGQGLSGGASVRKCEPHYVYSHIMPWQQDPIGLWNGSAPTCEVIRCPHIADPFNGQIEYIPDRAAPFDYGTRAKYSCDDGYELSFGPRMRVCIGDGPTAEGVWSGWDLTCDIVLEIQ